MKQLSTRAKNLMTKNNLTDVDLLSDYRKIEDFLKIHNCGIDTAKELVEYRKNLGFLYGTRGGNNPIESCKILAKQIGISESDFEIVELATPTSLDHTQALFLRCSKMSPMWFSDKTEGFEYRPFE